MTDHTLELDEDEQDSEDVDEWEAEREIRGE